MHGGRAEQADGFGEVRARVLPSPSEQIGLAESGEAAGFQWPHGELAGDGASLLESRGPLVEGRAAAAERNRAEQAQEPSLVTTFASLARLR